MRAEICPHCEEAVFPPRAVCPHCHREVRVQAVLRTGQLNSAPLNNAAAMMPAREFIYAMPGGVPHSLTHTVNHAIQSAMRSNGIQLVAAGDD